MKSPAFLFLFSPIFILTSCRSYPLPDDTVATCFLISSRCLEVLPTIITLILFAAACVIFVYPRRWISPIQWFTIMFFSAGIGAFVTFLLSLSNLPNMILNAIFISVSISVYLYLVNLFEYQQKK